MGYSAGAPWALHVAAAHPDRVAGVFAIGPAMNFARFPGTGRIMLAAAGARPGRLAHVQQALLAGGRLRRVPRATSSPGLFSDPHSTKPIEDFLDWSCRHRPGAR